MNGLTVGYLAERNQRKWPAEEAVVEQSEAGRNTSYNFDEFNSRVDTLANGLTDRGINQGDTVALYMKNNVETLEAFVAIMKLGALSVPINHRFKGEEVKYVLADSGAQICLLDSFGAETISEIHDDPDTPVEHYVSVRDDSHPFADSYDKFLKEAGDEPVGIIPDRPDEAGIMYTSGTTGKPKGCIYTHDNLLQILQDGVYERDHLEPGNTHLITTPLFHVGAFIPFLSNFFVAGTTIVIDGFEPERTMELIETEQVNSTYLVPTQTRMLLELEDFDEYDVSSLRDYSTGAAPVGAELKRETMRRFDCDVTESFGQTEALGLLLPSEYAIEKAESVGRPTLNLQTKVVDPQTHEDVPRGEVGLIAYKGPAVIDRYHNMPKKSEEAFDEGWFISGDLVRRDEDGFFYFVGRSDDMIITGGENVHPSEIEEVLQEHPSVLEVAIVGVPDETWGERVKACLVVEGGTTLTEERIVSYVGERLADYKKPREVEFYENLPRNPTGKVIKDQLT